MVLRMSSFWPPSLKTCDCSHRLLLGHRPLESFVSRSVAVA
jgi:hypothetical protein